MHLRLFFVVGLAVLTSALARDAAREAAPTAIGLSFPFFDESGKLTHKLTAARGVMTPRLQRLQEVQIDYYSATEKDRVVQRLMAAEANWDPKKEILDGNGPITVETEENRLQGEGFTFVLATGRLDIQRNFSMANPQFVMTSDRAEVDLVLQRSGDTVKLRDVRRCEAIGHLHVKALPTAGKKATYDEVFAERAIYLGETHMIEVPDKPRVVVNGQAGTVNGGFFIPLDETKRPSTKFK